MRARFAFLAALTLLAACSGGANPPVTSQPPAGGDSAANATFVMKVPLVASPAYRGRKFVSAATKAVKINSQAFNVSATAPGCSSDGTNVTCSFQIGAPYLGYNSFSVTTYDQPLTSGGSTQGTVLASGYASANIAAGSTNVIPITLAGVAAKFTWSVQTLTPPIGTSVTLPVTFEAKDADGYTIIGTYANRVTILTGSPDPSAYQGIQMQGAMGSGFSSSSDTGSVIYSGHWVTSFTMTATSTIYLNGPGIPSFSGDTHTLTPQPNFSTEVPVNANLTGATVWRDSLATPGPTTYVSEPVSGEVAVINGSGVNQVPLPNAGQIRKGVNAGAAVLESSGTTLDLFSGSTVTSVALPAMSSPAYDFAPDPSYVPFGYWVTEKAAGKVAHVFPCSACTGGWNINEYATGVSGSSPSAIAQTYGSEAFIDSTANAIVTFSTNVSTPSFKYVTIPSAGANAGLIASNGSGFWFTEPGVSKVGYIDYLGNIGEHPAGGAAVQLVASNEVFTLMADGTIDAFNSTSGNYTILTVPSSSAGPVVAIGDGGLGDLILLRSNGTSGTLQDYKYY